MHKIQNGESVSKITIETFFVKMQSNKGGDCTNSKFLVHVIDFFLKNGS